MSDPASLSGEVVYLGEPSPRKPLVAFLLTLLCPGFGAIYLGRVLSGVLICMLYVCAAGMFVVLWSALRFFPLVPLLVSLLGAAAFSLLLARDAAREAASIGESYIASGANHALTYVLVALLFYVLPLSFLAHFTTNRLWALVWVEGDAMYPNVVDGDLLLVDRTAFNRRPLISGDLVVTRPHRAGRALQLGRVIGTPGTVVEVLGSLPLIDGEPLRRLSLDASRTEVASAMASLDSVTSPLGSNTWVEILAESWYLVADHSSNDSARFAATSIGNNEYYLLHDNRSHIGDSRQMGPYDRRQVIGQPLYVAYSRAEDGTTRWSRVAKRIQP